MPCLYALPVLPRPAFNFPGAWFRLGRHQELHLIGNRKEVISVVKDHHFALKVNSAEKAGDLLKRKGVKHSRNIRPDGAVQLFFQDPDGYYIELFEFVNG